MIEILTSIKDHNSVTNVRKMMCNNPYLDFVINVNINTYTIFGEILSICSQDIERKRNYDRQNDGQPKSSIAPLFQSQAIIKSYMSIRVMPDIL